MLHPEKLGSWILLVVVVGLGIVLALFFAPALFGEFPSRAAIPPITPAQLSVTLPSPTSLPADSAVPTPSLSLATATPPLVTPVPSTPIPTWTATLTPPPIPTLLPTSTPTQTTPSPIGMRWIDVDLSEQMLRAYEGKKLLRSFLVSTGKAQTPTPIGIYHIWIKLRYDDMSGPGYYLRNVPFVMYFSGGYGIHGTYWHTNYGTPMSHGCVNMEPESAEWLFNWAVPGTKVEVHE